MLEATLDYSMFEQKGHIFAAYGLTTKGAGQQKLGRMEIIEIAIMPVEKIKELLLNGTFSTLDQLWHYTALWTIIKYVR